MTTLLSLNMLIPFAGLFLLTVLLFSLFLMRLSHKSPLPSHSNSFQRLVLVITLLSSGMILTIGYMATRHFELNEKKRIHEAAKLTLSVLRAAIEGTITRIDAGTETLSGSPGIISLLQTPGSSENIDNAHTVLDRYRKSFNASVVYLLDTAGTTIATSNRNDHDSFLRKNYAFRPYFRSALEGIPCSYFAVGVTSGKRGYYRSFPVKDHQDRCIGVAVIKNNLNELDSILTSIPDAFLVDSNNMIIAASNPDFLIQPLYPLSVLFLSSAGRQQQYGTFSTRPVLTEDHKSNKTIHYRNTPHVFSCIRLTVPGWRIVTLSPHTPVMRYRLLGFSATAAAILGVLIVISLIILKQTNDMVTQTFLSEKRFQTIFENAPEAIIICELKDGHIAAANPLARELWKDISEPDAITGLFTVPEETEKIRIPLVPENVQGLFRLKHTEKKRYISVSSASIQFRGEECALCFLRDVTGIIRAQKALEASERKYRELAEFLPEAAFETDERGVISYVNRRGYLMFGYTPDDLSRGFTPVDMIVPEEREKVSASIKAILENSGKRRNEYNEYTALHKNGKRFKILVHTTAKHRDQQTDGLCGIAIDLTERIKIEQELQKQDKLEALGIMAGGIAHDFNNLLTAIWSGFSLFRFECEDNSELREVAGQMENAFKRGRDLTSQLLTYSKGGAPVKSTVSLEEIVRETCSFVTAGSQVKYDIISAPGLRTVDVDSTQISQVIQNLLLNAIESMPKGGCTTIELRNREIDTSDDRDITPGHYVELICTDSGTGIQASIRSRVFDPFFSMKENGTGLGLSTAYSIVHRHNGYIYFESGDTCGTIFHVLLPASDKKAAAGKRQPAAISSGKERILLMDDEPTVLSVTRKLLSHLGYRVTTAKNGEEAVEHYRKAMDTNDTFDCVILDLTIPGGEGGKETIARLLKIDPQVKAIVSSGYSHDPIMASFRKFGFRAVITKPYNIQELTSVIRTLLADPAA